MNHLASKLTLLALLCFRGISVAADALDHWGVGTFPGPSNQIYPSWAQAIDFYGGSFHVGGVLNYPGYQGDTPDVWAESASGHLWTVTQGTFLGNDYNGVAAVNGGLAVNNNGISGRIKHVGGGSVSLNFDSHWYFYNDLAYGNGIWVAVGENWYPQSRTNVLVSTDNGVSWSRRNLASTYRKATAIAFGNGIFTALAHTGTVTSARIYLSPINFPTSLSAWRSIGADRYLTDVTFGNGIFAVAASNSVIVSTDFSVTEQTIALPSTNTLHLIKYLNNMFIAFAGRELLTSADGTNWVSRGLVVPSAPLDVAYGNGRFVAVAGTSFFIAEPLAANVLQMGPGPAMKVFGEPGHQYRIEASTNLMTNSWQAVTNITLTNSPQSFADPNTTNFSRRFYRSLLLQ